MKAIQSKKIRQLNEKDVRVLIVNIQVLLNSKLEKFKGIKKL